MANDRTRSARPGARRLRTFALLGALLLVSATRSAAQADSFGLDAWASDGSQGAGVMDDASLQLVSGGWVGLGAALDPSLVLELTGSGATAEFGTAVGDAGDVDGDGVADLIVGAPFEAGVGVARVFSGDDGSLIWQLSDGAPFARFGAGVAGVGDVDGDGVPDVAVGAPFDTQPVISSGSMRVYSGATGLLLFTVEGSQAFGFLGYAMTGVGDLDGDGFGDVLVGEPATATLLGRVVVVGGPDGHVILDIPSSQVSEGIGRAVAGYADYDGDGTPDLVAGAPFGHTVAQINPFLTTAVHVLSGADGSVLKTLSGTGGFGFSLAVLPDLDEDGLPDLAVGAPVWLNRFLNEFGRVTIVSPGSGLELAAVEGTEIFGQFGASLAAASDLDGDGLTDLAVGAPTESHEASLGMVHVFSVPELVVEHTLVGGFDETGLALASQSRLSGNVLIVGAPAATFDTGRVRVLTNLAAPSPAQLEGTGALTPGSPLQIQISGAPPSTVSWLVVGASALAQSFKGGLLVPYPDFLLPVQPDPTGAATLPATWPALTPPSWSVWLQLWTQHPAGPQGWLASNALRATGNA
jgi:hypothetical protein